MSIPNVKFSAGAVCERYYDGKCSGSGEQFNPDRSLGEAGRSGSDPFVEALLAEINFMKDAYRRLNDDFNALRVGCVVQALKLDATVTELRTLREEVKAGVKKPGPSGHSSATNTPESDPRFGLVDF